MGLSLENHLEAVFACHGLRYVRGTETENRSKPDFLFPGAAEYHDLQFPAERLTMLGAKSACKDRWRQVLPEAGRIDVKHLLTLEPSISANQTDEMAARGVQLVLPRELHETYAPAPRSSLMDLDTFINLVTRRQNVFG